MSLDPCTFAVGTPWSLGDAVTQLQNRLSDPSGVHWTQDEVVRYLTEALRTLSAYTQRYRAQGTIQTRPGAAFYDLPSSIGELRSHTLTSQDLILDIEYALMEPPGMTWTGTEQFNMDLILEALTSRRQQFLLETGVVQTQFQTSVTPDVHGRVALPASVVTLRRVAWNDGDTVTPLSREDEWATTHYIRTWPQTPTLPSSRWPTGYSVGVTPPLTVQLAPAPLSPGFLDVVGVLTGAPLTTNPDPLGIPDDWAWVVKWGALAELLSRDGVSYDPSRAEYCEQRWQQGTQMAKAASVVLNASVNGSLVTLRSLADLDRYRRTWQTTWGVPTTVCTAGQTLLVLAPPPVDATSLVTLDVVVSVPPPASLTDCLAVDEPLRDAFLDYAQHLAIFKEGSAQVQTTTALFERFQRACGVTTVIEAASVPHRGPILQQTVQDVRVKEREALPEPTLP
jgi:hypothetical protein